MIIDGFTYVRNGFKMGYPFIQSVCINRKKGAGFNRVVINLIRWN